MKYCLTLDLQNDPKLIQAYEEHHKNVWPEILKSIKESGILAMEIYRWEDRLFMIMETEQNFSFDKKAKLDSENPRIQEWENLMWDYQKALPGSKPGEKWKLMNLIFNFNK
jgi:L-rhamnose mutarotase